MTEGLKNYHRVMEAWGKKPLASVVVMSYRFHYDLQGQQAWLRHPSSQEERPIAAFAGAYGTLVIYADYLSYVAGVDFLLLEPKEFALLESKLNTGTPLGQAVEWLSATLPLIHLPTR